MLVLLLLFEIPLFIFLLGVLVIAYGVTLRHGDPSATYRLYSVRDKLIEASVFEGVPREGPPHWRLAIAVGRYQAAHSDAMKKLMPFPADAEPCPQPIRALAPDLKSALEHLARNHIGVMLQMSAHEREQRRIQRQKAKDLLQMMRSDDRCGCAA